jgi:hypothetical protein
MDIPPKDISIISDKKNSAKQAKEFCFDLENQEL